MIGCFFLKLSTLILQLKLYNHNFVLNVVKHVQLTSYFHLKLVLPDNLYTVIKRWY